MVKNWQLIGSALVATLAVSATIGFLSPASRAERGEKVDAEIRSEIREVSKRVDGHDVRFATIDEKLVYISDGIDDLRGKPRRRR